MLKAELIGDTAVVAKLRTVSERVDSAVRESIGRLALRLQKKVKQEKLGKGFDKKTGKVRDGVLHRRTGTLSRSINWKVLPKSGSKYVGVVSTNLKYARVHEYGFKGTVTVKEHLRMVKKVWGKSIKNPHQVTVKGHARKVDLPERSFLRSALKEMQQDIQKDLRDSVAKAVRDVSGR